MADLKDLLLDLDQKASNLKKYIFFLETELKKYKAKNDEQNLKIELYKQKISNLTKRNQVLKVGNEIGGEFKADRREAKKIIDELIQEVDRCITLIDR